MENTNLSTGAGAMAPGGAALGITESALRRIAHLLSDEPQGTRFRISINGGGCSGFSYHFDLDAKPLAAEDSVFGSESVPVAVDDVSLGLLAGSTLDYVEDLGSAGFEIRNPNATAKCGCGNSFSVA